MEMNGRDHRPAWGCGGYVADVVLRVVLLAIVLGEVVFLAGKHRVRVDMTADKFFTLTESTRRVLSKLEDRLLIECYFTEDAKLPAGQLRDARALLRSFLDEYVQLGGGKVAIEYYDPGSDKLLREKAERLGMKPFNLSVSGETSLTQMEVWQGMRLMYGAEKQKVIPIIGGTPSQLESVLTPYVKDLTVKEKPKIGLIAYATEAGAGAFGQQGAQPRGFDRLPTLDQVKGRYDIQRIYWDDGQHIPEDVGTLLLVRPKKLSDRQKYVLDQFLMRGGTLVVFADTAEFEIGQQRTFRSTVVSYDADDSKTSLVDQLAHYGVRLSDQVVAEGLGQARENLDLRVPVMTLLGQAYRPIAYPYWFRVLNADYAQSARQIAEWSAQSNGGQVDEAVVEQFRKEFRPGMAPDHPLLNGLSFGPAFFWPCPVELADPLPEGVKGTVLMRTSPISFAEDPPADLNPLGQDTDPRKQEQALLQFSSRISTRLLTEPRKQIGLMVHLTGAFHSFFEGKEIPQRKKPEEKTSEQTPDPLEQPIGEPPVKEEPEEGKAAGKDGEKDAENPEGHRAGKTEKTERTEKADAPGNREEDGGEPPSSPGDEDERESLAHAVQDAQGKARGKAEAKDTGEAGKAVAEPAGVAPAKGPDEPQNPEEAKEAEKGYQGPPPAPQEGEKGEKGEEEEPEPEPIFRAKEGAQLIVVGDSDFIRDDLTRLDYYPLGPFDPNQLGVVFFARLLDWLSKDQDLVALSNKQIEPRLVKFADESLTEDIAELNAKIKRTGDFVRAVNIAVPPAVMLLIWALVAAARRARKQRFLSTVGG